MYEETGQVYTLLVENDNSMSTTQKCRIVQRSKLIDTLWFLAEPEYNGYDMSEFTVLLEYLSPISKRYRTEILELSDEMYNGYLKYTLPINTSLTAEAGEVEMMLTFMRAELDEKGRGVQRVRKITGTTIDVVPIAAWSDIIPDCALSALDQRIIKMDAQIKALNEASEIINTTKADNLSYNSENNELQLTADGKPIGDKVTINKDQADNPGSGDGGEGSTPYESEVIVIEF